MRIIHVIPNLKKGGAERIVLDICISLEKLGHSVLLITFTPEDDYKFLSKKVNKKVIYSRFTPSIFKKNSFEIDKLQSAIEEFNPDVIHTHLFEAEIALSALNYHDAKYFTHLHDNIPQFRKFNFATLLSKTALTNYYERNIVIDKMKERQTGVIAISEDSFSFAMNNWPKSVHKHLLHNAIDTIRFQPNEHSPDQLVLTMIGSFVQKKGQALAIETTAILKKRGFDVQLNLVGDGALRNELEQLSKRYNLFQNVKFTGNINNPEDVLRESKIYLHTAIYEPFGLALVEAMATGLPVVCTDGRGNRDLIQNGENGFIIHERNAEMLADKIELLFNDPILYSNLSDKALQFSAKYDMKQYAQKLLSIYLS